MSKDIAVRVRVAAPFFFFSHFKIRGSQFLMANRAYFFFLRIQGVLSTGMKSLFLALLFMSSFVGATEISFTVDDPEVSRSPIFTVNERNKKILTAFDRFKVKGALFVCGMRIESQLGKNLLQTWDRRGHLIGNHGYSHLYFNSPKVSFEKYREDFLKVEPLISGLKHFSKYYRFPFLKEGETKKKRDLMREELKLRGYKLGYVSIDASDWYVDQRMRKRLAENPNVDLSAYRDFYLKHVWNRAIFYNNLAKKVYGREIKHTLLIHHSLLNALFLSDLMRMFKDKGWKLISAAEAYQDPVFNLEPMIVPAGESIVWASAKETGKFEDILRYPGEDGEYEKAEMDKMDL